MVTSFLKTSDSFGRHLCLLPNDVLDLVDLFLNLPINIFGLAFGFQVSVPDHFSDGFLDLAFHLAQLAFCVVLGA